MNEDEGEQTKKNTNVRDKIIKLSEDCKKL